MTATTPEAEPSDDELASRIARRGDSDRALREARAAFDRLYARHARLLAAFLAARARRDEAENLAQEVWQRVWHRLPGQYHGGNFRAWLHRIARNALIDRGRQRRPEALDEAWTLPDGRLEPPDARLIEHERGEVLRRCLEKLATEAAALVRARLGGESYREIASRLGMTPERAHKLFHQAKAQLQSCVERAPS